MAAWTLRHLSSPWMSRCWRRFGSPTPTFTTASAPICTPSRGERVTVSNSRRVYRVTHHVDSNLPLTSKQKFHVLKCNFCFDVSGRFESTWMGTLYVFIYLHNTQSEAGFTSFCRPNKLLRISEHGDITYSMRWDTESITALDFATNRQNDYFDLMLH